uniref:Uncharacterized protein n=1 Tax=Timema shepardi TaxID=629360 RepID=A0A7R9B6K6_TIMSH|nr:unnamed protein product [Timema shepardi]
MVDPAAWRQGCNGGGDLKGGGAFISPDNYRASFVLDRGFEGKRGELRRRGQEEGESWSGVWGRRLFIADNQRARRHGHVTNFGQSETGDCNKHIPIYNYVSGPHTLTFQENTNVVIERILEVPSAQAIWYPWGLPFRSVFWYRVFAIFVHVIPGALLDIAFVIKGNPPILFCRCLGKGQFHLANYVEKLCVAKGVVNFKAYRFLVLYCPSNHQGSLIGINRMDHLAFHI